MSMTDPIADFLTRIRNAIHAGHKFVDIPSSVIKKRIAQLMLDQHFIANYTNIKDDKQGLIRVYLKYDENGTSVIQGLERISKPGLRKYVNADNLPRVRNNLGMAILSTSKGIVSAREAQRQNVGGEWLCNIW
jgi:small subunit ribosomal protein S8